MLGVLFQLAVSCTEKEQSSESFTGSYQFFLFANLNGQAVNYNAGEDGYSLYTSYQFEDSLLVLHSLLAKDSADPRSAFELIMRSAALGTPGQPTAASLLQEQSLALADPSGLVRLPNTFDYLFYTDSLVGHQALKWTCLGQSYYGDTLHWPALDVRQVRTMEVKLTNNGFASCVPLMAKRIDLEKDCRARMDLQSNSSGTMQLSVSALKGDLQKVRWFLNNKQVGQGFSTQLKGLNSSIPQRIKAEVIFGGGCKSTIEKTVIGGRANCDINILLDRTQTLSLNPKNAQTVELVYYDAKGKRFSTFYDSNQGYFTIEALSTYQELSARGEQHQKLVFSGEMSLQSADGARIEINRLHGSFAVAHP